MSCKNCVHYGPAFQRAQVDKRTIRLEPSCAALNGRTLLFMSDIHLSERFPEAALKRLLEQAAALHPDLLLLGGDYAESADWQKLFFRRLGAVLTPPLGIYAVLGNNDIECFPSGITPLLFAMRDAGVTPLVDQTFRLHTLPISIAGLDELRRAKPRRHPLFQGRDLPSLRILLAHYPHSAMQYLRSEPLQPNLCLTGHTHGGQIRLMGLTPYSFGFESDLLGIPLPTVSGWAEVDSSQVLVSPGIGTSRLPIRICSLPCIHHIQLSL